MKVKTSFTLSEDLLSQLEEVAREFTNRSDVIEQALRLFLKKRIQKIRESKDLKILNREAADLNDEAEDVLSYQVEL